MSEPKAKKKFNPYKRRYARRFTLQALYQWQLSENDLTDIEKQFIAQADFKKADGDYFKTLLHNIPAHLPVIDDTMRPYLDRKFDDLDPVELSIMRIAIYEMLYCNEIPYRVAINEALELAKQFGAEDGYKYVNGILDKVAQAICH